MSNAFREYQGSIKDFLSRETRYHRFGFIDRICDQEYIIGSLENLESYIVDKFNLKNFDKQSGFRVILKDRNNPSLDILGTNIKVPFAFRWKESSEDVQRQINELELLDIRTYDLRNQHDFEELKHYFQIEIKRTKEILDSLINFNDPFPIVLPFYKCACWNCTIEKIEEADIFFWQYSTEMKKLIPSFYFSPKTYSMFMMFYLHFFILFSEKLSTREHKSKLKRYRLRDHLRKCYFCHDYFIGPVPISINMKTNKIKMPEFPCCQMDSCKKKYDVQTSIKSQNTST